MFDYEAWAAYDCGYYDFYDGYYSPPLRYSDWYYYDWLCGWYDARDDFDHFYGWA